jgi:hypothetical protein
MVEETLVLSTIVHSDNGIALRTRTFCFTRGRITVRDQPGVNFILDSLMGSTVSTSLSCGGVVEPWLYEPTSILTELRSS